MGKKERGKRNKGKKPGGRKYGDYIFPIKKRVAVMKQTLY